jgi:Intrinsic membrane protein PufX
MSDQNNMISMSRKSRLRAEMTYLMLKGAGVAALVFFGGWIVIAIIAAIGRQLPEDSRSAADPTPLTYVVSPDTADELPA